MSDLDLRAVRARFPALAADVVHADAPGGTQVLGESARLVADWLTSSNANSHGVFATSERADEMVSSVRRDTARLLGGAADGIVFGPNMTTLAWHLSHALTPRLSDGDAIVCTRLDHDANVAPWLSLAQRTGAQVRWVELGEDSTLDLDGLDAVVRPDTRLVAFPLASNALGTLVDPGPLVEAARAVGALTVADAVHAAPHVPLDQRADGIDVLFCSPYKFFGPHAGVMSADPALLADLTPDKVRPAPDTGPDRWQTGTANFESIAGVGAAVRYLLDEVELTAVREHELELTRRFLDGLESLEHVTLHGVGEPGGRTPTFALTFDGLDPLEASRRLAAERIWTWAGSYYAVEPMRALGLHDRGGAVRIGFVHYHGDSDVDRVLGALERLATR
jgi:cysteine desulfurase family protein (TIGR01976 family)